MRQPFEQLEYEFGQWVGIENCVAVASGTAALHLALEALEIGPGSSIAIPDMAMVACARAATLAGLNPAFVDCDEKLLIDASKIHGVKAIMPVHIYGRQVDLNKPQYLGRVVVEDLAEAHGISPHPHSAAACWSFYKNKIVHGEEGGMIAFPNPYHAKIARELRSLGFGPDHNFMHRPRGINARMSNLHATPILESLRNVETNLNRREMIAAEYNKHIPKGWQMPWRDVVWVYDVRIPGLIPPMQDYIVKQCRLQGVEARHCFKPMSIQPEYLVGSGFSPAATRMSNEVMYLPVSEDMGYDEVKHNAKIFMKACREVAVV